MPRSDFKFAYPKRVRYAEIDAQAVLFNSRYLEYFDIGVTEYMRTVGIYGASGLQGSLEFHVAKALVEYKAPIILDEIVDICVRCVGIGTSSMTFLFELHGVEQNDLRASGEEVAVHMAKLAGRPAPLPKNVIDMMESYEGVKLQKEKAA
jgi:acyl-CoA thioester hydrolase